MNPFLQWLKKRDSVWTLTSIGFGLCCLAFAALGGNWVIGYAPHPLPVIALLALVFGAAQLLGQRWARWVGLAWVVSVELMALFVAFVLGWDWVMLLAVAAIGLGIFAFVRNAFRPDYLQDDDDRPFLSLVLLFRERPYLDADIAARLASQAWDMDVRAYRGEEDDEEADNDNYSEDGAASIIGDPPLMIGMHPDATMMIHAFDTPYFEDAEVVAQEVTELRIRNAILEHQGWVAVDILHWHGEGEGQSEAYRLIARFLAELADDNVLAVIDTDAEIVIAYDRELEEKLRSHDPRTQLRKPHYVPIVTIEGDDPELVAAVEEAQQRWPEFVAAFEQRHTTGDENFSVKAPFGEEGAEEFMWVAVTGMENDIIYGELGNEPATGNLKIGDRVNLPVAHVNDWIYLHNDELIGGFSVKVLAARSGQRRQ